MKNERFMKMIIMSAFATMVCLCVFSLKLNAQAAEIEQLLINYEKLTAMEATLDQIYNTYKVLEFGYNTVSNIASGNYSIHQLFIDGLMAVNPSIRNYKRIPFIISYQQLLLQEYQRANNRFRKDPNFSASELTYLSNVYSFLLQASVKNIDDLLMIITFTKLSMTDDERLAAIDRIYYDMEFKLRFVRSFNNSAQLIAIQRAKSVNDVKRMRQLNNIY